MKGEAYNFQKQKIRKDFSFLFDKPPIFLNNRIAKYLLVEGEGEPIIQLISNPFDAYYSYCIYDYQGKILEKNPIGRISSFQQTNEQLKIAILSMKIKEKAWFNISDQPITQQYNQQPSLEAISPHENRQQPPEVKSNTSGRHYQIILDEIQYRNAEKIEIKRIICTQNREKGMIFLQQNKFIEAVHAFKNIIRISDVIPKKKYSQEEYCEIESMNLHAKLRYLQSYFRIVDEYTLTTLERFTKRVVSSLLKKQSTYQIHYYHSKWLIRMGCLDLALLAAKKSFEMKKTHGIEEVFLEIAKESKRRKTEEDLNEQK